MVNTSVTEYKPLELTRVQWERIWALELECECDNPHRSALACRACQEKNRIKYGDAIPFEGSGI